MLVDKLVQRALSLGELFNAEVEKLAERERDLLLEADLRLVVGRDDAGARQNAVDVDAGQHDIESRMK